MGHTSHLRPKTPVEVPDSPVETGNEGEDKKTETKETSKQNEDEKKG